VRAAHLTMLLLVFGWNIAILTTPYFSQSNDCGFVYGFFSVTCHQKEERSFFLFDQQMPVCARCTGIYFFLLLGTVLFPLFKKPKILWLYIFLLPMALDGGLQLISSYESNNLLRFITGGLAGLIAPFFIIPGLDSMFRKVKFKKN